MLRSSGRATGPNTEPPDLMIRTAPSLSLTTGRVPSSALSPGSAEEPDFAREADGAQVTMDARELPCPSRPPVCQLTTEVERDKFVNGFIGFTFI